MREVRSRRAREAPGRAAPGPSRLSACPPAAQGGLSSLLGTPFLGLEAPLRENRLLPK